MWQEGWKMKTFYIAPDVILTYIIGDDDIINKMIDEGEGIVTSAYAFHEVISALSIEEIKKHSGCIVYLLQKIPIVDTKPFIGKSTMMKEERRKELRSLALGKK